MSMEQIFALAQATDTSGYFWGGIVVGLLAGAAVGYLLFKTNGDNKARQAMLALERERAQRHAEMEKAQAERGATIDEQQLARLKNEVELSAINIQLAKSELSQRMDASTGARLKAETELSRLNVELARLELAHRQDDATRARFQNESEISKVNVELARRDLALRGDHLNLHDRMMEKANLEIESLKLQIKEQRKRLDDYGTSD
jgi:hypothetical protein